MQMHAPTVEDASDVCSTMGTLLLERRWPRDFFHSPTVRARSPLRGFVYFLPLPLEDKSNAPRCGTSCGSGAGRAAKAVWDAEEGCAITPDDRHGDTVITDQTPTSRS
jgi:hypothetical protein